MMDWISPSHLNHMAYALVIISYIKRGIKTMAKSNPILINKLREAATQIESGADYNWGHVGKCNCGHLLQAVSPMSSTEIYKKAQIQKLDEWSEYANDYCPASGVPMDDMIDTLMELGLDLDDIHHLEYLSNKLVLEALPGGFRYLQKGNRDDAVTYMKTWADVLELELQYFENVMSTSQTTMRWRHRLTIYTTRWYHRPTADTISIIRLSQWLLIVPH